jgi:hypothetical protein
VDLVNEIADLAQIKYGRNQLKDLLDLLESKGMEVSIQETDIDPNEVPVEQVIEMEKALTDLLELRKK